METFGDRLRSVREQRGLTIRGVAEALGADENGLRALERNEFRGLPDEATTMRWLRAYAECLRVDAELMIEDYARERERCLRQLDAALPDLAAGSRPAEPRREHADAAFALDTESPPRTGLILTAAGIVGIAAILGAWWFSWRDVPPPSPMPTVASPTPTPNEPPAPAAVASAATPEPSVPVAAPRPASSKGVSTQPASVAPRPSGLQVPDHGVGTSVANRELVGRGNRFPKGTDAWFWTRVEGGTGGETLDHVWLRDGVEALRIPLKIGGARWRTYSAKTLRTAGPWTVEARDSTGRVLARDEFVCVP